MRIKDLKPYTYSTPLIDGELAVGWLDGRAIKSKGLIQPKRVRRLVVERLTFAAGYLRSGTEHWMGVHSCTYCDGPETPLRSDGRALWGNGEFRVRGADGTVYVAPTLVAHYVEAHQYLPPQEFVDAVLRGDFIEQVIDLPPDHVAVGTETAPGDLRDAVGEAVEVVLIEREPWDDEASRPMLALQLDRRVYGPWDGTVDHASEMLRGEPLPVLQ